MDYLHPARVLLNNERPITDHGNSLVHYLAPFNI